MRVEYTPINIRDPRGAGSVNAFYTAIEAASSVDASNLREEGHDRRAFVNYPQGEIVGSASETTRSAATLAVTGAVWTTLVHNATTLQTGAIDLLASDLLEIRGRVFFQNTFAAGVGLSAGSLFELRVAYDAGAGVLAVVHSERPLRIPLFAGQDQHGALEVVGVLPGALTLNFVRLQYKLDVISAFPLVSMLHATRFRRVV